MVINNIIFCRLQRIYCGGVTENEWWQFAILLPYAIFGSAIRQPPAHALMWMTHARARQQSSKIQPRFLDPTNACQSKPMMIVHRARVS
jgi:hypothetical protein